MKNSIKSLLSNALSNLVDNGTLPTEALEKTILIERTKDPKHGDFATNIALVLAKLARTAPRVLAEKIQDSLGQNSQIEKIVIAGPGFINFYLSDNAYHALLVDILKKKDQFGRCDLKAGKKIQVEFVSANPTGPLHVGHGRGAAYGAVVADLLDTIGYQVHREYYVNDAGRQMDILATSVWLRYLELCEESLTFPTNGYKGDYIWDIAATLHRDNETGLHYPASEVFKALPEDEKTDAEGMVTGDKEQYIDALIAQAKTLLGADYKTVFQLAIETILSDIKADLSLFGVEYQQWFSEQSLMDSGKVDTAIKRLQEANVIYEKAGALWFRTTDFGDEKDRVVVRDNGQKTYFASDIAYHLDKFERGFDEVIDVWGADHHGYVARVKAALTASNEDADRLHVLLVQFANLYRHGEKVSMSTRGGNFVTLRSLRKEVGNDAARFFYAMRKCEQHLDFDLDLAKSQSNDNPVYYVQYAHARICSTIKKAIEKKYSIDQSATVDYLSFLVEPHEKALIKQLAQYQEIIIQAALNREPHVLTYYVRDLATQLQSYYNAHHFLVEDENIRKARVKLISCVQIVLKNGLKIIGVSAPERM